jgi:hypothetical protein
MYKSPLSYQGQLMDEAPVAVEYFMRKVFGDFEPDLARKLFKTSFMVYPLTVKQLYEALQRKYIKEIRENTSKYGSVKSIDIDGHEIIFNDDKKLPYDRMISTIPLNAFCEYSSLPMDLQARTVYYYNVVTDAVDLEGAQQSYVCDLNIPFFKAVMLNKSIYVFWCLEAMEEPYKVFGSLFGYNFEILEVRFIEDVIPMGNPPSLGVLEDNDVFCVGSNAQWDDFMDVSSCINRLLAYRGTKW